LAYVTNIEPILIATYSIAALMATAAFLLLIQVMILRARLNAKNRHRKRFIEKWRPIIAETLYQVPELPLILKANERSFFIEEWNHFHEILEGNCKRNLIRLANKLDIDRFALRMLHSKHFRERLTAVITLGHLREFSAWDKLKEISLQENSLISLAAIQALMQIDAKNCATITIQLISKHGD